MKYLSLLLIMVLSACGGSTSSDGDATTLADIVGVWDETETDENGTDESYLVFTASGDLTIYDYQGDSYDMGENCYEKEMLIITDQGSGIFSITDAQETEDPFSVALSLSSDRITATFTDDGVSESNSNIVRTDRLESSFTPLCEEEAN